MSFVNLSLFLGGSALVVVPIVLHLIMRRKPKLLEFPAMRFVQKRHDMNRRRMRLRHLLLLLARMAAIALLAFALARPSVQFGGGYGSQEAPVAAVLVFDTAPRMEYKHNNQTRLDAARRLGLRLIAQLPEESQIAVLDARPGATPAFQADRGAAKQRIERLETVTNSQSLATVVERGLQLLHDSDLKQQGIERKELYIFTDLARGAWPREQAAAVRRRVAEMPGVGVYVTDVGIANPTDFAIGDVRPSAEVLSNRSPLTIEADLACLGPGGTRTVELHLLQADGTTQKRDEATRTLKPGEPQRVEFRIGILDIGTHQGFLRLLGQDGLAADDTRCFTVEVKRAWRVLLAAPKPAQRYAIFLSQALAPSAVRKRGEAQFDCELAGIDELAKKPLTEFAAVCLLDPPPLEPGVWKKLRDYLGDDRGLAVFLGRNARPVDSFNDAQAQEVLPGKLLEQVNCPDGDNYLAPRDMQHPLLAAFRGRAGAIPWDAFPVLRYWTLRLREDSVAVVVPYRDGRPAVLDRTLRPAGRVVTMTTPVSDRPSDRNAWNLLPAGEPWPFVILARQMLSYLVGASEQQLNYFAGQQAVLPLESNNQHSRFLLTLPSGASTSIQANVERHEVAIGATEEIGNYRVQAGGRESGVDRGFSVNLAPDQTQLERIDESELDDDFGKQQFSIARNEEQIDRNVTAGRVGRELFPPAIVLLAVVLGLELLLANRFYREEEPQ